MFILLIALTCGVIHYFGLSQIDMRAIIIQILVFAAYISGFYRGEKFSKKPPAKN